MTVAFASLANAIRALAMDAVQAAKSGHPGMPMGMADVATVLFRDFLKFDAADPRWHDRDRFVLSAGHGSMLAYALLHLNGYERPTIEDVRNFRQLHSPTAGHPENFELPGIECTTGPLGQGLAMAVGMAIAERHLNAVFGDDLVDHATWVIAGDGCLMEGINHEAVGLAGHLGLGRLNVLWDDNRITIDGDVSVASSEDVAERHRAAGWHVTSCDGHDEASIRAALAEARADARPSLVACRTVIGYGAPNKQGTAATHGSPLGDAEIAAARERLGWTAAPFDVPGEIAAAWTEIGRRGRAEREAWQARLDRSGQRSEFLRRMEGQLPADTGMAGHRANLAANPQDVASRKSSELALEVLTAHLPEMIGGSADLTGSNNTRTGATKALTAASPGGRYVHYGIREFGMAAAMNGMALHGGVIPYGGTFLVFADYCRAAIRMAALQRCRSVFVLTHDSIGLGEDGPTHQPIEHLMALRCIPNCEVFRPCDAMETAECWELALANSDGPSVLALSRQTLPQLRFDAQENRSARGAYVLKAERAPLRVALVATGSEVSLAVAVAELLESGKVGARVISMPSMSRFAAQDAAYRESVLPEQADSRLLRVSIEAGTTFGWSGITGIQGLRFGIDRFGASAPAEDLYRYFGLTPESIHGQIVAALR